MEISHYLPHIASIYYFLKFLNYLFVVYVMGVGACAPQCLCEGQRAVQVLSSHHTRLGGKCHLAGPYFIYLVYIVRFILAGLLCISLRLMELSIY